MPTTAFVLNTLVLYTITHHGGPIAKVEATRADTAAAEQIACAVPAARPAGLPNDGLSPTACASEQLPRMLASRIVSCTRRRRVQARREASVRPETQAGLLYPVTGRGSKWFSCSMIRPPASTLNRSTTRSVAFAAGNEISAAALIAVASALT